MASSAPTSAASRTRAITSSSGSRPAIRAFGNAAGRSRVTKVTSASGSGTGVSSAAAAAPGPALSMSLRGSKAGMLAESSVRVECEIGGDAHVLPHAHALALAVAGDSRRANDLTGEIGIARP